MSCLLVYPCSDPWPPLPCALIVGRRVALSMVSQHPLHVVVGGAQRGAFGVKKAGEGELAAKIDAPISICMLVTSVIQRNPGQYVRKVAQSSEALRGVWAAGPLGEWAGVCNIVLIHKKRLTIKEKDTR